MLGLHNNPCHSSVLRRGSSWVGLRLTLPEMPTLRNQNQWEDKTKHTAKKILRASLATLFALISFTLIAVIGSHIVLGVHVKLSVNCGNGGWGCESYKSATNMKNGNILSEKVNKIRYRKSKGKTSINACCELDCIPWLLSWLQQGAPLVHQTCKLGCLGAVPFWWLLCSQRFDRV